MSKLLLCLLSVFFGLLAGCEQPAVETPREVQQQLPAAEPVKEQAPEESGGALTIFQQRILPIFNSPKPSSCTECHLAGLDLKDYITSDQQQTFASLKAQGLIDVKSPEKSKILEFIQREPENSAPVRQEVRRQEYDAFKAWIAAAVKDPGLLQDVGQKPTAVRPELPVEVIRHARQDRVLSSFVENVWSELNRCAACHSPQQNQKQVAKFGKRVSWITPDNPHATLDYLVAESLIDPAFPEESLLLTKPSLQVDHQGGLKISIGDRTYRQFERFINDYAAIKQGKYTKADQLPAVSAEVSQVSDVWLKLTEIPARFGKSLLRVEVYAVNGEQVSETPWAAGDRPIFPEKALWQQHLTIIAPRGTPRAGEITKRPVLPAGRYQLRIYVDQAGKLANDPQAELGVGELVAETVIESRWDKGYGSMTVIRFPQGD